MRQTSSLSAFLVLIVAGCGGGPTPEKAAERAGDKTEVKAPEKPSTCANVVAADARSCAYFSTEAGSEPLSPTTRPGPCFATRQEACVCSCDDGSVDSDLDCGLLVKIGDSTDEDRAPPIVACNKQPPPAPLTTEDRALLETFTRLSKDACACTTRECVDAINRRMDELPKPTEAQRSRLGSQLMPLLIKATECTTQVTSEP